LFLKKRTKGKIQKTYAKRFLWGKGERKRCPGFSHQAKEKAEKGLGNLNRKSEEGRGYPGGGKKRAKNKTGRVTPKAT